MEFSPYSNLSESLSDNGIIRLWADSNLLKSEWRLEGDINKDINMYFFLPHEVIIDGNTLKYNNAFEYVNKSEKVTGWVEYRGPRELQDGLTDVFWHMEESENKELDLQTDPLTKLPFIITPVLGRPQYVPEKRYFIPVNI